MGAYSAQDLLEVVESEGQGEGMRVVLMQIEKKGLPSACWARFAAARPDRREGIVKNCGCGGATAPFLISPRGLVGWRSFGQFRRRTWLEWLRRG